MAEWRKAIPEGRDRLQSKVLVWCVMSVLGVASLVTVVMTIATKGGNSLVPLKVLGISLTFGVLVWALRAATPAAAMCGSMVCLLVTLGTAGLGRTIFASALSPLATLFVTTFAATRAGRSHKIQRGLAESRRGRNAAQVVANLGAAALTVVACVLGGMQGLGPGAGINFASRALPVLLLAALCEATADTVSSEIGQAFGGKPVMVTSLRRVPAGTDGAVTVLGTVAGVMGAAIVAAVGMWGMGMGWKQALIGLLGGVAGLVFDSLLGATVERRGWMGNDLVNFSSTVFAVGVALGLMVV